jgi:uncharacterized protein YkwD
MVCSTIHGPDNPWVEGVGSRRRGKDERSRPPYGGRVTVTAAGSVIRRLGLRASVLVVAFGTGLALLLGAGTADAASRSLLTGSAACVGAEDPLASEAAQRKAIVCLVNLARRNADRPQLATPSKLRRAASIKGRVVVSCGQLSHTPCGAAPTAALRAAGYRYSWFGENLWYGTWGSFSPRQVVESWLGSPGHRANVLRPSFRHFGTDRIRADGVFGEPRTAVWVATFASPLNS